MHEPLLSKLDARFASVGRRSFDRYLRRLPGREEKHVKRIGELCYKSL